MKLFIWLFISIQIVSTAEIHANPNLYLNLGYSHGQGMFSIVTTIIGLMDLYETDHYAGVEVDFQKSGFYYDPQKGLNWWNYYFEPICLGDKNVQKLYCSSIWNGPLALRTLNKIPFSRCNELLNRYVQVRPEIQNLVSDFVKENFEFSYVIGVHYRGTDKWSESPTVAYEKMLPPILELINSPEIKNRNYKIFVATDEAPFLDFLKAYFPSIIVQSNAHRSSDSRAVHTSGGDTYQKGKEAIIDCLLLSKCDYLIRTSSSLSLCATFFNPNLPVKLLNPGAFEKNNQ